MKNVSLLVLFCLSFIIVKAQVNLSAGLAAYYPFTGNANDVSGNNNNPSFNNATLTTDRFGNPNSAYHFNGTNNYMQIPNSASINFGNTMSICVWVRPTGFYTGKCYNDMIVAKEIADYQTGNYSLRFADFTGGCGTTPSTTDETFGSEEGVQGVFAPSPIIQPNQWYSVVFTSDGTITKLYVNCQLMGSSSITATTYTNSYDLFLGELNNTIFPYWLNGDLDEVRLYNRAINQDEVDVYGGCVPPCQTTSTIDTTICLGQSFNGHTTTGTYVDTLINVQGCDSLRTVNLTVNNCAAQQIINTYTPVTTLNVCENKVTVQDASTFNIGDTVLMIQMKGAIIDSSNTNTFGTVTNYKNCGNYEFNYVKSKSGNIIQLQNNLTHNYDVPNGEVQLIRVPYYTNLTVTNTLTCLPWDGSKGGVLVFNVKNTLTLQNNIDVSGNGFRGGIISNNPDGSCGTGSPDYYYPLTQPGLTFWNSGGAQKGEGITEISDDKDAGKGRLGNGGGGGNKHNTGGGGGGNYSSGGKGGNELAGCTIDGNGGIGGFNLVTGYNNQKIFMGGGGGRGDDNNGVGTVGVSGGGIIIFSTNTIIAANTDSIKANGNSQLILGSGIADGAGGGGAGGCILMNVQNYTGTLNVQANGGNGGSQDPYYGCVGPGGGGSGGYIATTLSSLPGNVIPTTTLGKAGVFIAPGFSCTNTTYGATDGQGGAVAFNLTMPVDNIPFKKNIDSVRINDTPTSCSSFNFNGLAYINISPIATWLWYFDDGATANTQNTSHNFAVIAIHSIKLVVTDGNGCTDSISISLNTASTAINAGNDTSVCKNVPTTLHSIGTNIVQYAWSPKAYLNDSTLQNPVATIDTTIEFYLTVKDALGCIGKDSVTVSIRPNPVFTVSADTSICGITSVQLNAGGGDIYSWSPATLVNNATINNPMTATDTTTNYTVTIKESTCNHSTTLSTKLYIYPPVIIQATKSSDLDCSTGSSNLLVTGSPQYIYVWSPATGLSNPNIYNPIASPSTTQQYIVKATDTTGCYDYDSVTVNLADLTGFSIPNAFTPNNDGYNDVWYITTTACVLSIEADVYNRWGSLVYHSDDYQNNWDGKYQDKLLPDGTYYYVLTIKTPNRIAVKKGSLTILR